MSLAIKQAQKSKENREVPVGCVFADLNMVKQINEFNETKLKETILAEGHNMTNITKNATEHCEIICINKLGKIDYSKLVLFVTCEPCIMCAYALVILKIGVVYFGCYNQRFGGNGTVLEVNKGIYHSYGGYLEQKCIDILKTFYEEGNQNIDEQFRHRKDKKVKQTE